MRCEKAAVHHGHPVECSTRPEKWGFPQLVVLMTRLACTPQNHWIYINYCGTAYSSITRSGDWSWTSNDFSLHLTLDNKFGGLVTTLTITAMPTSHQYSSMSTSTLRHSGTDFTCSDNDIQSGQQLDWGKKKKGLKAGIYGAQVEAEAFDPRRSRWQSAPKIQSLNCSATIDLLHPVAPMCAFLVSYIKYELTNLKQQRHIIFIQHTHKK